MENFKLAASLGLIVAGGLAIIIMLAVFLG